MDNSDTKAFRGGPFSVPGHSQTSELRRVLRVGTPRIAPYPQASPEGLRHGLGVAAVSAGVPLNLVQKWLGHAQLTTTALYADAVGAEERDIARRMWE